MLLKIYIFYLLILRETGREGRKEGEKHQCVVASHAADGTKPTAQACSLTGNGPATFDLQDNTHPTEPRWSGPCQINFHKKPFILPQ